MPVKIVKGYQGIESFPERDGFGGYGDVKIVDGYDPSEAGQGYGSYFGDVDPGIVQQIQYWQTQIQSLMTQLLTASAASNRADLIQNVSDYQVPTMLQFVSYGQELQQNTSDTNKIAEWVQVGNSIISTARSTIAELGTSAVSLLSLVEGFPTSVEVVLSWANRGVTSVLNAAGQAAATAAGGVGKTFLILTACAAGGLYLLRKLGGLSASYGPIHMRGFDGYGDGCVTTAAGRTAKAMRRSKRAAVKRSASQVCDGRMPVSEGKSLLRRR